MAQIIWNGNKNWDEVCEVKQPWDREIAGKSIPENSVLIDRPNDIFKSSIPYIILPCIVCFVAIFIKKAKVDEFIFDLWFMPLSFIIRKEKNMTQKQLADALSISDKTISKWECGKGLPEVSLMLPLCEMLQITVNDLLTGARVSEVDYQKKAEENMVNLMKENEENKKRMVLSIVCGVITIIAVLSLVVIASYIELPAIARIALIVFAIATAVVGIGAAAMLEVKAGYYECPHCKALFVPTMSEYVKGYHTLTKRRLTCHECGKVGMCKHRIIR